MAMEAPSALQIPLLAKEHTTKNGEDLQRQLLRRSLLITQPPVTAQDCTTFYDLAMISEKQEKKIPRGNVKITCKHSLARAKFDPKDQEPVIGIGERDFDDEMGSMELSAILVESKDLALIYEFLEEDQFENLNALAARLWPVHTDEAMQKVRDPKGRPLLFLAVAADSLFMVEKLVKYFNLPVNQIWKCQTAIDIARTAEKVTYRKAIENYLRERGGNRGRNWKVTSIQTSF